MHFLDEVIKVFPLDFIKKHLVPKFLKISCDKVYEVMIMFLEISNKLDFDPEVMKDVGLALSELDKDGKYDLRHKAENLNFSFMKKIKENKYDEY